MVSISRVVAVRPHLKHVKDWFYYQSNCCCSFCWLFPLWSPSSSFITDHVAPKVCSLLTVKASAYLRVREQEVITSVNSSNNNTTVSACTCCHRVNGSQDTSFTSTSSVCVISKVAQKQHSCCMILDSRAGLGPHPHPSVCGLNLLLCWDPTCFSHSHFLINLDLPHCGRHKLLQVVFVPSPVIWIHCHSAWAS